MSNSIMITRVLILLSITFPLFTFPLMAQVGFKGEISGVVTDSAGSKRSGVGLGLLKAADSSAIKFAVTDEAGRYRFENVAGGDYYIAAMNGGGTKIVSSRLTVSDARSLVNVPDITLSLPPRELATVTVAGQKPLIERKLDRIVLNVENSPLAAGNSALEVIARAPGVSVDNEGAISLRGKQGVNVLINGKPTYLSAADLANMLRATDGSTIQSVEIISNPSARYDASGSSGVIDIKLKKDRSMGTNGSIVIGSGWGNYYKGNGGLSLSHREGKVALFANYNYLYNKRDRDMVINRVNETSIENTYFQQNSRLVREYSNHSFKAGIDYNVSSRNTIGFTFTGYANNTIADGNGTTLMGPGGKINDSLITDNSDGHSRFRNMAFNLNNKTVFDSSGRSLSVDLDYSEFSNKDIFYYDNYTRIIKTGIDLAPVSIRNITPATIRIYALKADYAQPLRKGYTLESGVKISYVKTDNDLRFDSLKNGDWKHTDRSNQFIYDENVYAAYLNVNKEFSKTKIQAGLRAEHTNLSGNSVTLSKVTNRNYTSLFPTLFVSRKLGKEHELMFSYGRRINRPNYQDLNPFIYFVDKYTLREGNPYLNPQFANTAGLSYIWKDTYAASFEVSGTNDAITQVLLTDTTSKILYQTNRNLAKELELNLNISVPVKITDWWTSSNDITVFYLKYQTPELLGAPLNVGKTGVFINSNNSLKLGKRIRLEVIADYKSPITYGTVEFFRSQFYVDLGMSYSLFGKRANLKLGISDVFNTLDQHIRSVIPAVNYSINQKNETRVVRLTFTYRFGNNELKPFNNRRSGVEDETKRVQPGN
ncbi:outer membrane beta-barrel protein [Chitinophaga qingshengii]|uniref:TonB-dependent receptor n=1 Tax=Chitinophaga qingshengii TaxID=1569794 RepID=A0ABR7TZP0_9BACT|nr:outer membrane beta-barrel protein [Chitinophaga qingshengii]MBC9934899.1 TonB-dependent receptor [Chitinophaga qingshengii]